MNLRIEAAVRYVLDDGLPTEEIVRDGRALLGYRGALVPARVHPLMANPYHPDVAVWQLADGAFLYNVTHWVELSMPFPPIVYRYGVELP